MTDRVIVVQHADSGTVLKVCASWEDYDHWAEEISDWDAEELQPTDAAVNEYV